MTQPLLVSGMAATSQNVWCPDPDGVVNLAYTNVGTDREALPTDTQAIRLYVSTSCYYRLGNVSITVSTGNGIFLPGGAVEEPIAVGSNTYIAIIRDSVNGDANVTKLDLVEVTSI